MGLMESIQKHFDNPRLENNSDILISTISGNFLVCWEKESYLSHTSGYDKKCILKIEMPGMDRMYIKTMHNTYLSAEKEGCISQIVGEPGERETFYPVYLETEGFVIKTFENKYLFCCEDFKVKTVLREEFNDSCKLFKGYYFKSLFNQ